MKTKEIGGWSWRQETELMKRLVDAQNDPATMVDLLTIVGTMSSRVELQSHVVAAEQNLARSRARRKTK